MSKHPLCKPACVLALLLFCLAFGFGHAAAQTAATTGEIAGTVRDTNGAAVANANVTVTNTATNFSQTVTSNEEGNFRAVNLPPGDYSLKVAAQGFGAFTQTGYKVEVGSSVAAQIALQVGAVTEEVLVTSAAVETTQTQTPTVVNQTSIEQLPINGRRFQDFVLLTPTADTDPNRGQISLVGQRGINSNIQIDGADYNNPFFGGIRGGERSNQAFTFPQESIREFQVVASGYNAEFGRSTGGVVNAVTKSGTNNWNGSSFVLLRHEELAALNAFGQPAAPTQTQFGGSLGGPIVKNKAFFFVAAEGQKLTQARSVLFTNLAQTAPTTAGVAEAFNFFSGLQVPYTQTNNAGAFIARADYNFNSKHNANVRYNYSKNTALNAVTAGTSLTPTTANAVSNNGTEGDSQNTVAGQLNSFFSPTLVNEFRAQYSRENRPRIPNELSPTVSSTVGTFGTVNFLPTTEFDTRTQLADAVTWTDGNHSFKFGGEFNHTFASQVFAFRQEGQFNFTGTSNSSVTTVLRILSLGTGAAGDPANRFDEPSVQYQRNIGNGDATLSSNEPALFLQDSWRLRPNLTVNYGLRWEAQFMPQADTSNTALTNLVANTNFPIGEHVDPSRIPNQVNQFGPRLGIAWDPFSQGKTVVRAYTGVYYARTPLLTLASPINNFRNPPGDVTLTVQGFTNASAAGTACANVNSPACPNTLYKQFLSIGIDLNTFALGGLPVLSVDQVRQIAQNIAAARGQTFNPNLNLGVVAVGDQLRNPRSFQYGFAFEHELSKGLTIGVTFDHVNTSFLNINRDLNVPAPIVRAGDLSQRPFFGLTTGTPRPISTLDFVQIREASGRSNYDGLTFRGVFRRKWGQFDAFYTLSRDLDNDSTERNATFAEYDNGFNLVPEYNYSRLDARHRFTFNTVLNLWGGFQFSSLGRFRSGYPIDIGVSGIVAPPGSGLSNAQYAALVTIASSTSGDLNGDRGNSSRDRPFSAPGVSFKRNAFRNTRSYNIDMRLQRDIKWGEHYRLSPTIEVFNIFGFKNIQYAGTAAFNYGNPGVNERTGEILAPSNVSFLKIKDANNNYFLNNAPGAPRQVQVGLRFQF
jgi:outer membrane receptor for ferrienterochelin and colicin